MSRLETRNLLMFEIIVHCAWHTICLESNHNRNGSGELSTLARMATEHLADSLNLIKFHSNLNECESRRGGAERERKEIL